METGSNPARLQGSSRSTGSDFGSALPSVDLNSSHGALSLHSIAFDRFMTRVPLEVTARNMRKALIVINTNAAALAEGRF
jgi:hypothetical protein